MNNFWDIFLYNPAEPLLFTQMAFWIYFAIVYSIFSLLYKNIPLRNSFLLLMSLFFYYKAGGLFVLLLIFSIVANYSLGLILYTTTNKALKKVWLIGGISLNLALLFYYKYTYFLADSLNKLFHLHIRVEDYLWIWGNKLFHTHMDVATIVLPIGISFFTFHALNYVIDVYRGKMIPLKKLLDFGFFISFFPQLVAGPIIRATEFIPQIGKRFMLSKNEFGHAAFLIMNGLIKKIIISDFISLNFVDRVFENPNMFSGIENLFAMYGYAIQIYCDFSGYTDIAIGLALLLGFRIPVNFNSPYKAYNLIDFWRRWHISLSLWLRDYLYISLGGNRKGKVRTQINVLITMLLGGLWHGANIKFVIWGALHGVGLVINKIIAGFQPEHLPLPRWKKAIGWLITFHFVCFAWIFFRADNIDTAFSIIRNILSRTEFTILAEILTQYAPILSILAIGFIFHWLPSAWKETYRGIFIRMPLALKFAAVLLGCLLIYQFKTSGLQPFIYFQF